MSKVPYEYMIVHRVIKKIDNNISEFQSEFNNPN